MLTFFADPYKDELIYSAAARYHYYIGNIDYRDTLEELFGKRSIIPNFYTGSYLNYLCEQLDNRYNTEELIGQHTIFPFYAPFLPEARKQELIQTMKTEDAQGLYTKLGMVAGSLCAKENIYYCYNCVQEDIKHYGEPYIHREHQLQGVMFCPHHGCQLQMYKLNKRNSSRLEFIRLDERKLEDKKKEASPKNTEAVLLKLSKMAYALINGKTIKADKSKVEREYKVLLNEKGLVSVGGSVRQEDLYNEFMSFYDKKVLEILESQIDIDDEYNWLKVVTRNAKRTVHPMRHLLLINFLTGDVDTFFEQLDYNYNPFGAGPWPCLNTVAEHYRQKIITEVEITPDYKTRVPVGTFKCDCGFVYSRKGPDITEADLYKIGRIKAFGVEWDKKFVNCINTQEYSLRGLAREMNCDPKTILKKDIELKTYVFNAEIAIAEEEDGEKAVSNEDETLESYKTVILNTVEEHKDLTRTQLRALIKKEYAYVYRRDKKWLLEHLPGVKKIKNTMKVVDWPKRDKELLRLVKGKYSELINNTEVIRITKSLIGKELGISSLLEKHPDKIPYPMDFLSQVVEAKEEFQLRKCKWVIEVRKNDEGSLKLWEVQRAANIRTSDFECIKSELEKYIDK